MEPIQFSNLGGKPRVPDKRDHLIGAATAYDFPPVKMNAAAFVAPIYYQGKRPACGAHAGVWYKTFMDRKDGKATANETPRYLWINIKRDGTSPSDGTSMDAIFKSLQSYGSASFEPLENDVTFDDGAYASLKRLTPAILKDGQGNRIDSYAYPQDVSFNGIKQTIADFGACLLLIQVCDFYWTAQNGAPSWKEKDILPLWHPSASHPVVSAHFVVAHSYDEKYVYFANSFGPTWGRNGHGYFGPGYMPWIVEKGVMHNPPKEADSSDVIASGIDAVKQGIDALPKVPESERSHFVTMLSNILKSLSSLIPK